MEGAALDTYENARRKAYTAARSDAFTTRELTAKVASAPTELASFVPQFSFFLGGVAAFLDGRRGRRGRPPGPPRRRGRAARGGSDPSRRSRAAGRLALLLPGGE